MIRWVSRCIPGLSTLCLIVILILAFRDSTPVRPIPQRISQDDINSPYLQHPSISSPIPALKLSQKFFIFYILMAHTDTFLFTIRLFFSILVVKKELRATLLRREDLPSGFYSEGVLAPVDGQELSQRSPKLYSKSVKFNLPSESEEVIHAIIIPNYQEDIETLRLTLDVLASHPRAGLQYKIYLAMEQKEQKSPEKASVLISSFESKFLAVRATFHPSGLPGEIAGKSSNVAFAANDIFRQHKADSEKMETIITVIDSDTHLLQDYFTEILRLHNADSDRSRALYVCPIVFDRNSEDTTVLVRVADLLWGGAGLAGYTPWAPVHIPTSVYSLPLSLAQDVGGWDGDATAIGEDMHMLLKCYFNTGGSLVTKPIFSPASQSNVSGEHDKGWRKSVSTIQARYKQALRHMWGSLDSGYAVRQAVKTRSFRFTHIPLFHLLWEAHFLPVHFVLMLIGSTIYTILTPRSSIHPALLYTFWITTIMRNLSFLFFQAVFIVYDDFHRICVHARAQDMRRANVSDTIYSFRKHFNLSCVVERISIPIVAALYGAIPAFHAQICHFWTDKLVYTVSRKPQINVQQV